MSVELIKKPINVYQAIDEQQKEELLETGMIVPDSKPDVLEVLVVDTDVVVKTREKTGKVMEVGGEISYQVIYRADNQEQSIEAINVKAPWSVSCNFPAREEDVYTITNSTAEHTDIEIVNGRKLSAKSVVKLNIKYLMARTIEAGESVQGDNVYQKAEQQDVALLEDMGERMINVSENLELPEGRPVMEEIMHCHASIKDPKIMENMNLDCMLELDFLYRAENDNSQIENVHMEIPVTKNLDIDTYNYTDISVKVEIKSVNVRPDEDLDGLLTRVRVDVEIGVEYILYSKEMVYLVKDAYALDYDFELEKRAVNVSVEERDISDNLSVNSNLQLANEGDTLEEVLNVTVKPKLLSAEKEGAGIEVNGCLDVCVLYGTGIDMRVLRGTNQEVQFTHRIALPEVDASYDNDVQLMLNSNSFEIVSDTELGIKAEVSVKVHISKKEELNIVTGVRGVKPIDKKANPPLLIYYTRDGDTLWDIARNYRVPIQKILNDNGMTDEIDPEAGQKIFLLG